MPVTRHGAPRRLAALLVVLATPLGAQLAPGARPPRMVPPALGATAAPGAGNAVVIGGPGGSLFANPVAILDAPGGAWSAIVAGNDRAPDVALDVRIDGGGALVDSATGFRLGGGMGLGVRSLDVPEGTPGADDESALDVHGLDFALAFGTARLMAGAVATLGGWSSDGSDDADAQRSTFSYSVGVAGALAPMLRTTLLTRPRTIGAHGATTQREVVAAHELPAIPLAAGGHGGAGVEWARLVSGGRAGEDTWRVAGYADRGRVRVRGALEWDEGEGGRLAWGAGTSLLLGERLRAAVGVRVPPAAAPHGVTTTLALSSR